MTSPRDLVERLRELADEWDKCRGPYGLENELSPIWREAASEIEALRLIAESAQSMLNHPLIKMTIEDPIYNSGVIESSYWTMCCKTRDALAAWRALREGAE